MNGKESSSNLLPGSLPPGAGKVWGARVLASSLGSPAPGSSQIPLDLENQASPISGVIGKGGICKENMKTDTQMVKLGVLGSKYTYTGVSKVSLLLLLGLIELFRCVQLH